MDDSDEEVTKISSGNYFCHSHLEKKLDEVSRIINDSNYEGSKEYCIRKSLQSCIEILSIGKNDLECFEKQSCTSSSVVNNLISYEKGVIACFKHCSESSAIYGDLISIVQQELTELFQKTASIQTLFFSILETVKFDFTIKEDLELILNALKHVWYGAEAVYNASNKIMSANWKVYIKMSQTYSSEIKEYIINDEPINFLCAEIKQKILSLQHEDEITLKLISYMIRVLINLNSYGRMLKCHNTLIELLIFLNSFWQSDEHNAIVIKERLLPFAEKLVLASDETFVKIFQSICQVINSNSCSRRKISALRIVILLSKRVSKSTCDRQAYDIIHIIFQLIQCSDSVMSIYDIYVPLLVHSAAVVLASEYSLFETVETILIQNIVHTEYWPAMFSSDLWIIIMRYLSPEMCNIQFSKLARLLEELVNFPCFTQSPQHIYIETLLRRHFLLVADKKRLVNSCPQLKNQYLASILGLYHVPTLSKYNYLSELTNILSILPEQKNIGHLNEDIINIWSCVKNEYPLQFLCALIEVSIGSETLIRTIIPKCTKILSTRAVDDSIEIKRCRIRLIRSILLLMPSFQENLMLNIFLEYLFDHHPMVRQWTIETIVYFVSVTGNQNNLISILFKRPEVGSIITDYLKMKINYKLDNDNLVQYFDKLSISSKFQHKCSFTGKLDKLLDNLKTDIDCLNYIVSQAQPSLNELERLKEYSTLLNNICDTMQFSTENV